MDSGSKISKKGRTVVSCDRCKSRKTKCINSIPGPCDFCASVGATCQIDMEKRRQKPYYFVSEEEYRLTRDVLKGFLPDQDLSLPNLRALATKREVMRSTVREPRQPQSIEQTVATAVSICKHHSEEREKVALQEIIDLHQDLGCILADASGEYRYMGADSGISFNTAVRTWVLNLHELKTGKDIISPLISVSMPKPTTPSPSQGLIPAQDPLPSQDFMFVCASRYFEEVHCLYWLYSSEQFYSRLENAYNDPSREQTASWMCSLLCVVALGSLVVAPADDPFSEGQTASRSLEMAKTHVPTICDEAAIDGVRAFMLLALALQSQGFSNSAYLYVGVAVRIGFSLGLHLDKYSKTHDRVQREAARRIWWTLVLLDQDLSLRLGKPEMLGSLSAGTFQPPQPSEQILNPGPNTPPGYLALAISLSQLARSARQTLYIEPLEKGEQLNLSKFDAVFTSLEQWRLQVPPHLSPTAPAAPSHRRSISLLHIRYWSVVILVSRPFLLCTLLRQGQLQKSSKLKHFEAWGKTCINAALEAMTILQEMAKDNLLSSLILADFYLALELVQIFVVAYALEKGDLDKENARTCLELLRRIGMAGAGKHLLPEVLYQLEKAGFTNGPVENDTIPEKFDETLLDMDSGNELYNMLFNIDDHVNADVGNFSSMDIDISDCGVVES